MIFLLNQLWLLQQQTAELEDGDNYQAAITALKADARDALEIPDPDSETAF